MRRTDDVMAPVADEGRRPPSV